MEVGQRVASGAALLDQTKPGWHRNVNVDTLSIARGDRCALGQTYGSFAQGVQVLRLNSEQTHALGFMASGGASEFDALTAEWRREIESRLDAERATWAVEQAGHRVFRRYRLASV